MYYDNKRLALSVFWVILGAVLLYLTFTGKLDNSVYSGMGGALIAVGVIQIIKNLKYRNNADYREKVDTAAQDERNTFIRMKSWSWTGYIVVLVQGVGVIIAMVLGKESIQIMLSYSVCLILIVYWIAYMVISRKY